MIVHVYLYTCLSVMAASTVVLSTLDDPTSRVHGNVVHGVFEGSIFTEEETYRVEPASR